MDISNEELPVVAQGFETRQAQWMVLAAAVLGVSVDILFHGERLGISFPIWAVLSIAAMIITARQQDALPEKVFLLPVVITLHAALAAVRMEPLSRSLNVLAVLVLFAIWLRDFRGGGWLSFGWVRVLWSLISIPVEMAFRPWGVLGAVSSRAAGDSRTRSTMLAVLRGVLLAIPVLLIFGGLLSAADLVFSDVMTDLLHWFDVEWLRRALNHLLFIAAALVLSLGALVTALRDQPPVDADAWVRRRIPRFIGTVETLILLVSVNALFLLFVVIQVRYFFGGELNITAAGYTYAEYARRGFSELVIVAFLSLGMISLLNAWGKWENVRTWFKGLCVLLVGEVAVMLVSAFQRLMLYEQAYGFTRLRLYTHVAIVWLGIALMVFLVLLILEQTRHTVLLAAAVASGFILTLNAINVDARIVRQNHTRYLDAGKLDTSYFLELSFDAVPAMVDVLDSVRGDEQEAMLANLACQRTRIAVQQDESGWPSTHLSRIQATAALGSIEDELEGYEVIHGDSGWIVRWDGGEQYCGWYWD